LRPRFGCRYPGRAGAHIRLIQFDPQDVVATRVNYSFDFLPYS